MKINKFGKRVTQESEEGYSFLQILFMILFGAIVVALMVAVWQFVTGGASPGVAGVAFASMLGNPFQTTRKMAITSEGRKIRVQERKFVSVWGVVVRVVFWMAAFGVLFTLAR